MKARAAFPITLLVLMFGSLAVMLMSMHVESPYVAAVVEEVASGHGGNSGSNNKLEVMYSKKIGTVLILYHMTAQRTAGIVWRITENMGAAHLGNKVYETTSFAADRAYWERVVWRDGYTPLSRAMSMAITTSSVALFTGLLWMSKKLRGLGRGNLADYIDNIEYDGKGSR